ncbi:siderophore-interacting protein [Kiloniella antarctica]|uniref:Siderophore-interacting protein n=1 Tax=Kiloniella antarctica TaxID=1550907 RepID=A0ABW5BIN3_9PROT
MSKRKPPRILSVVRTEHLTPHMLRVTLGGIGLHGFPEGQEGAHVKVLIPEIDLDPAAFIAQIEDGHRPTMRTYTIRHHRVEANELDIDFAIHGDGGPASNWAKEALPGDYIGLFGPGPKKMTYLDADWFLLAADMTAIPAAAAALEELPEDAVGTAVFEVTSEDDRQLIDAPRGIDIHWLVHKNPDKASTQQSDFIRGMRWRPGHPSVFVAGEAGVVKELRNHLHKERGIPKEDTYVSAYWKIGLEEDAHQIQKRMAAAA